MSLDPRRLGGHGSQVGQNTEPVAYDEANACAQDRRDRVDLGTLSVVVLPPLFPVLTCHALSQSRRWPAEPMTAPRKVQNVWVARSLKRGLWEGVARESEKALVHSDSSVPKSANAGRKMRTER